MRGIALNDTLYFMKLNYFGVSRILSTYGKPGYTDAVIDILDEYSILLEKEADCLTFHYGTVIMPSGNSNDRDPFSVWVNEVWATEDARTLALRRDEVTKLDEKIAQYLEFEPETGVKIDIHGGKIST